MGTRFSRDLLEQTTQIVGGDCRFGRNPWELPTHLPPAPETLTERRRADNSSALAFVRALPRLDGERPSRRLENCFRRAVRRCDKEMQDGLGGLRKALILHTLRKELASLDQDRSQSWF